MESNKLKKMMKKIEDVLAAASFAEEGESESARLLLREGRRVLLALKQGRIDAKTVKYAVNSAKRIGADLDILFVSSSEGQADPLLEELESGLTAEGVTYRLIRKQGCLKEAVIDYTNREKEILFAVVESPESLDADCRKKDSMLSELWQKLKCPLVVVMDQA
ncbi:MAG: hypothetical protein A2078_04815 [Nitrospirae bacterium GWC2_57_9]|nr:MAG: hypothetical protein A2078_04815 [Nitrospirae bacterium GWC2_57_9]